MKHRTKLILAIVLGCAAAPVAVLGIFYVARWFFLTTSLPDSRALLPW